MPACQVGEVCVGGERLHGDVVLAGYDARERQHEVEGAIHVGLARRRTVERGQLILWHVESLGEQRHELACVLRGELLPDPPDQEQVIDRARLLAARLHDLLIREHPLPGDVTLLSSPLAPRRDLSGTGKLTAIQLVPALQMPEPLARVDRIMVRIRQLAEIRVQP